MQINLKLDCTLYTGLGVHFYRNIHLNLIVEDLDLKILLQWLLQNYLRMKIQIEKYQLK